MLILKIHRVDQKKNYLPNLKTMSTKKNGVTTYIGLELTKKLSVSVKNHQLRANSRSYNCFAYVISSAS